MFHISDDFNFNVLDHDNCKKIQNFLNLLYQNNMNPIKNKPTIITRKTATETDHIIINCLMVLILKLQLLKEILVIIFRLEFFCQQWLKTIRMK